MRCGASSKEGAQRARQVARRVDADLPVLDDGPLRGKGLARLRGQPGTVDAQVEVQKGVAPLDALDPRLELRGERRAHRAARAAPCRGGDEAAGTPPSQGRCGEM